MNAVPRLMRLLLIAALGAGLAGCGGGSSQDSPPASPLRLENAAAVTQTIGPAGGTLTTTAADGTAYTLTVPPTALRRATAITLAPIASIADLPAGVSVAGGVHLTPEGQAFDMPVKLTIALARPPSSAPIPFTYAGELTQRRLYPAVLTAGTLAFDIVHFSGYAALLAQPDVIAFLLGGNGYLPTPGAAGDQALQALVSASLQLTGEARSAAMRAALRGWLDTVIKPAVVSTQAITTIDVNPSTANAATIEATTRLRGEMQVFDIALKYALLAGADVNALYPDFQVAVRDAARHVIPLFNAACSQFASAWFLAVPDVFAWQELARLSSATALEPALERAAVLDALCVQVAYDPNGGTDFPSGIQPGQTGTLGVRAGFTVNGGPVRFDEPMLVSARGTNTSTSALLGAGELVAPGARYQQQFLWEPATTEMRIDIKACLADELLREICQQAFVVRGVSGGGGAGGAVLESKETKLRVHGTAHQRFGLRPLPQGTLLLEEQQHSGPEPFVQSLQRPMPVPPDHDFSGVFVATATSAADTITLDPSNGRVRSGSFTARAAARCTDLQQLQTGGYSVDQVSLSGDYQRRLQFRAGAAGATLVLSGTITFTGVETTDTEVSAQVEMNSQLVGELFSLHDIRETISFNRTFVIAPGTGFDIYADVGARCVYNWNPPLDGDRTVELTVNYTITAN